MTPLRPPPGSILTRFPWLLDASSWRSPRRATDPPFRGTWAVGNGWVFAHAGLVAPASRLQGLVGPTYETAAAHAPHGAFGDTWIQLEGPGIPPIDTEELWRPRGTDVLVSADVTGPAAVVTVSFAPPDLPVVIRLVEVWGSRSFGHDVLLAVHLPQGKPGAPSTLRARCDRGRALVARIDTPARVGDGVLTVPLHRLAVDNGVVRATVLLACGDDVQQATQVVQAADDPAALLQETRADWSAWLGRASMPDLWPQRCEGPTGSVQALADLVESALVCLRTQRALPGGPIGSMVHAKGGWARQAAGPVRALLALGYFDEVRDLLEYSCRVSAVRHDMPGPAPLDLSLSSADMPRSWSDVAVPRGDAPAWIVLQHWWWLEAGGAPELVHAHWDYLARCATAPHPSRGGLLPFDAEEVYLHGGLYAAYPERLGWPNDLIAEDGEHGYAPWSLDATWLHAAALEAMARMGRRLGRGVQTRYLSYALTVRTALRRHFWMEERGWYAPAISPLTGEPHGRPFAPVNLRPLWLGVLGPPRPHATGNLRAVLDHCGFTRTTPSCGYTVGDQGGYLLDALLAARSDVAPRALAYLTGLAAPAGEWAELYGPDGRPTHGHDAAAPNRFRPGETGVNLSAIVRYFRERHPDEEPVMRGDEARPLHPSVAPPRRRWPLAAAPAVALVSSDGDVEATRRRAAELELGDPTPLDAGLPLSPEDLADLLFDPATGRRRAEMLLVGAEAAAAGHRTMKPASFWQHPAIAAVLQRFVGSGGRLLGVPGHH